ncbi:hypothetical protein D3C76_207070 [compost metagenome]
MLPWVAPFPGLVQSGLLDRFRQRWPTKVLVLDVDELSGIVHRLQVHLLDLAPAFLGLAAQQLAEHRRAAARMNAQPLGNGHGLARGHQVLAGFLAPGAGEVVVQVLKNRSTDLAGNVLARLHATWTAIGRRLVGLAAVERRMRVGVPVLVEHVVAHDETDGTVRQGVVDQHALLMVSGRNPQDVARAGADMRIEAVVLHLVGDFGAFEPGKTPADEQRTPAVCAPRGLAVGNLAGGEPLPIEVILRLGRALQGAVAQTQRALAGQVRLTHHAGGIERHLPAQNPHLHALAGFGQQQLTNARRTAITDEIHRGLEAPADDVDRFPRCGDGQVHGAERFLAIDQRLVAGRHRVVLRIADEPRRGQGALVGVLERQGRGDFNLAHWWSSERAPNTKA